MLYSSLSSLSLGEVAEGLPVGRLEEGRKMLLMKEEEYEGKEGLTWHFIDGVSPGAYKVKEIIFFLFFWHEVSKVKLEETIPHFFTCVDCEGY